VIAAHGVNRQGVEFAQGQKYAMPAAVRPGGSSGANGVLERLTRGNHFAAVIVAAVAADVMGALQFAAVAALGVGLVRQSLMAAPHSPARGRRLTFRNSHGSESFYTGQTVKLRASRAVYQTGPTLAR
jgi:hypothetical protein